MLYNASGDADAELFTGEPGYAEPDAAESPAHAQTEVLRPAAAPDPAAPAAAQSGL